MYNGNAQLITFHCLTVKSVTIVLTIDREYAAALSVRGVRYDFTTVGMLAKISATMLISNARSGSFVLIQSIIPPIATDRHHTSRRVSRRLWEPFSTAAAITARGPNAIASVTNASRPPPLYICAAKAISAVRLHSDQLTMFGFALPRKVEIKYPHHP
jgi:hypothetical protein